MKTMTIIMFYIGLMMPLAQASQEISASAEDGGLARMRAQVELQRRKEEELQLLQIDVERLKLEVEKKKAMAELGQLAGAGQGAGDLAGAALVVVLKYVFISAGDTTQKEAVFDVGGIRRCAREGEDVGGRVLKEISAQGVILKARDGQEERLALEK